MTDLKFIEVNDKNKFIARELLTEYGHYLFDELKLISVNRGYKSLTILFPDAA